MSAPSENLELVSPESKSVVFRFQVLNDAGQFLEIVKYNLFTVILIEQGSGELTADLSSSYFSPNSVISLSLYQPFNIAADDNFKATVIQFHPEFFCLHRHRNEVSCNGVLFNNIYESPVMDLTAAEAKPLRGALAGMELEMKRSDNPDIELLISYLKILLIGGSRLKVEKRNGENGPKSSHTPAILTGLKSAIEENFRLKHSPADYAGLLNITPAALNRISKIHYNKTLSNLIAERLITEGKRELYLTAKPVKQIAYELGFNDEFYFSRYFKNSVGISPQYFRDTVGFDKANY